MVYDSQHQNKCISFKYDELLKYDLMYAYYMYMLIYLLQSAIKIKLSN